MCSNCDDGEIRSHWRGCDFVVVRARVLEIDGTMTTRRKRKEREVSSRYLGCSPQAHRSTLRIRIQCGALVSTAGRRELYLPVRHLHVVHKIHSSIYLILGRKSKPFHRLLLEYCSRIEIPWQGRCGSKQIPTVGNQVHINRHAATRHCQSLLRSELQSPLVTTLDLIESYKI